MWGLILTALVAMTPAERLQSAETAATNLEYGVAIEELQILLADPTASDDERERAHLLAGTVQRITGNDVQARLHFASALKANPQATLTCPGSESPKVQVFFQLVRDEVVVPVDDRPPWKTIIGGTVGGVGLAAVVAGGVLIYVGRPQPELVRSDAEQDQARALAAAGAVTAVAGLAGVIAGGVIMTMGLLE
jgi:hypothetical protein